MPDLHHTQTTMNISFTKAQIKEKCRRMGYDANYLSKERLWDVRQINPSGNSRAFDGIVFVNMTMRLGIDQQLKGGQFQ